MTNENTLQEQIIECENQIRELENLQYEYLDDQKELNRINAVLKELYSTRKTLYGIKEREKPQKKSKRPKEKVSTPQWIYEKHDKEINPNQWVIETNRKGDGSGKESFEAFKELKRELYRRKEGQCLMALVDYFGENEHHFRLVLYQCKFEELYGFSKSSYSDSLDALLFYGILEPTWRIRIGTNDGKGRVMVFHTDFSLEELKAKEKYNPKNPQHKDFVRALKDFWLLSRK